MSERRYFGTQHIFTNNCSDPDIYISPGVSENLTLKEVSNITNETEDLNLNAPNVFINGNLLTNGTNIDTLTTGKIWIGNDSNVASERTVSGDATLSTTGVLTFNTVNLNTGYFGDINNNVKIQLDEKGRVTSAENVPNNALLSRQIYIGDATNKRSAVYMQGDATISDTLGTLTLASVNPNAGTYGSGSSIPVITTNAKGLITSITATAFSDVNSNVGTFGSSTQVPVITANSKGQITAISTQAVVVDTTLPNNKIWIGDPYNVRQPKTVIGDIYTYSDGQFLLKNIVTAGNNAFKPVTWDAKGRITGTVAESLQMGKIIIGYSNNEPFPVSMSGDATISYTGLVTLATVNASPGTWGTNSYIPNLTVDERGRVVAISHVPFADVNTNVGTFGSSTQIPVITANSKGQITALSVTSVAEVTSVPNLIEMATDDDIAQVVSAAFTEQLVAIDPNDPNTVIYSNGYKIDSAVDENGTSFVIFSCPALDVTSSYQKGGLAVAHKEALDEFFTFDYYLTYLNTTSFYFTEKWPTFCCIDHENADLLVYGDSWGVSSKNDDNQTVTNPGRLFFFRRTNLTWALEYEYSLAQLPFLNGVDAISIQVSGDYAIIGYQTGVKINKKVGSTWNTVMQTLTSINNYSSPPYAPKVTITSSGSHTAFLNPDYNMVTLHSRDGESWYGGGNLYTETTDKNPILDLDFKNTALAYCTKNLIYVYTKDNEVTGSFAHRQLFSKDSENVMTSEDFRSVALSKIPSGGMLLTFSTETTIFYASKKHTPTFIVFGSANTGGGNFTLSTNGLEIFIGRPYYPAMTPGDVLRHKVVISDLTTPEEFSSFKLDNVDPTLTTLGNPVTFDIGGRGYQGGFHVIGDVSIERGYRFFGFPNLEISKLVSSGTLALTHDFETILTTLTTKTYESQLLPIDLYYNSITPTGKAYYRIFGKCTFADGHNSGYRRLGFLLNSNTIIEESIMMAVQNYKTVVSLERDIVLNADDRVQLFAEQTHGSDVNAYDAVFQIVKLAEIY